MAHGVVSVVIFLLCVVVCGETVSVCLFVYHHVRWVNMHHVSCSSSQLLLLFSNAVYVRMYVHTGCLPDA